MSESCVFCRILDGSEPASFLYRDDRCAAFMDIQQQDTIMTERD